MEFILRFDSNQVNLILKGLEVLREGASDAHSYVVQQVSAQAQARSTPAPQIVPAPIDTAPVIEQPPVASSEPSPAPSA